MNWVEQKSRSLQLPHPSTEAFKKMTPRFEEITGIKVTLDEMEEGALGQN